MEKKTILREALELGAAAIKRQAKLKTILPEITSGTMTRIAVEMDATDVRLKDILTMIKISAQESLTDCECFVQKWLKDDIITELRRRGFDVTDRKSEAFTGEYILKIQWLSFPLPSPEEEQESNELRDAEMRHESQDEIQEIKDHQQEIKLQREDNYERKTDIGSF